MLALRPGLPLAVGASDGIHAATGAESQARAHQEPVHAGSARSRVLPDARAARAARVQRTRAEQRRRLCSPDRELDVSSGAVRTSSASARI
ncbi:hypothetical protein PybrP1_006642 [[Pythium] brassicae (nom. inval.)]|nr:hypothetical protein PybrP1_006642 [[Pythium] brassicae (nom. inval.)]